MTRRKLFGTLLSVLLMAGVSGSAGSLDDIRKTLEKASLSQVQEKVYVHTDNQCYFVGDTLWYKAYVVRADNLEPTNLSRVLYVELLSPDGLLVERQTVVVNPKGYTCGQFCLKDSLYSGFYEVRAYTRWMLNFNMRHHRYRKQETWWFYNRQMAADYFRMWDGLYSRVLPIYSKPEIAGDYTSRRMYQRPKQRLSKPGKDNLNVSFFPEGGHLVEGVKNRVAFSLTDQQGECVNLKGQLTAKGMTPVEIKSDYMGRGTFVVTPMGEQLKACFSFRGKDYTVNLPKAERCGVALQLNDGVLRVLSRNLPADRQYGVSVLCRGALKYFAAWNGNQTVELPIDSLPTGVNDVTFFDDEGRIWADRLFFVNHHEQDSMLITSKLDSRHTYEPYERVEVPVVCQGITEPTNISLSFYDTGSEEPTYDDGNVMTSMLLSSELRGFIAHPAYYFQSDDEDHRRHLDQLMMVQGWRKYKWQERADSTRRLNFFPETGLIVTGAVYKTPDLNPVEPDEIESWAQNQGLIGSKTDDPTALENPWEEQTTIDGTELTATTAVEPAPEPTTETTVEYGRLKETNNQVGVNHATLKHEVLVEAEIIVGSDIASSVQKTTNGRFLFYVPAYYGDGILNMKAYSERDSLKKNMLSRQDKSVYDEDAFPDYYVKRDLFFPVFTDAYDFYQNHQPDYDEELLIDTLSDLSMENDVHQLANINVKGKRRGKRAVDWTKPAFVRDAYDLYNDITDRGLSWGKLDMRQFPVQVAKYLYGNMNRYNTFNVDGRLERYTYYRNYQPDPNDAGKQWVNRNARAMYNTLKLKRLQDVRVFSDYEPRQEDSVLVQDHYNADVTVEMVPLPDDGVRPSYRDRHITLHGFNAPEAFYEPDYSERQPTEPTDYRRTLYWNPNALTDEQGRFTAVFFNNSKQTRIKMTAAGVTSDGRLLRNGN